MKTSKEEILHESLKLFAKKGYEAVSVKEIATAVGIKEASLYNHFKNKKDIFDSIVKKCHSEAKDYFTNNQIPFDETSDITIYKNIPLPLFTEMILKVMNLFLHDENHRLFRQLLLISQFSNEQIKEIYKELYYTNIITFQSKIFRMLVTIGEFKQADPMQIAIDFYGVPFMLMHTCDSQQEMEPILRAHVEAFVERHHV